MQQSLFLLDIIEKALNRYLSLDPETKNRLHALEGKSITIILKPFNFSFQFYMKRGGVQLLLGEVYPAEIKIIGTSLSLLSLALAADKKHGFFSDDIVITGNIDQGQQIVDIFDKLEIDWEEQLSKVIGDIPAYEVGSFVRKIKNWSKESAKILWQNIDEYIHEEQPWVPPIEALKDFYDEVDELRMTADRLEARIRNL